MGYKKCTETVNRNGLIITNVPYNEHDYYCDCGCGELMKSHSAGVIMRVKFLFEVYLVNKQLIEFDYLQFPSIEDEFKTWWNKPDSVLDTGNVII
ncbi:hypothetical protein [Bacillus bombysepticus]|uniref:hypothetical protein n=1 Tax=Bacillus bombysepticus TaxID=658666 RepID=UPI0030159F44